MAIDEKAVASAVEEVKSAQEALRVAVEALDEALGRSKVPEASSPEDHLAAVRRNRQPGATAA